MNNVLLHFIISINCYKIPSFSCVSFPTFRSSTHDNVILQGFFFVFSEWFANCCFCGAHRDKRVIFRLHTDRSNSFFSPDKEEKEWVFFVWTCTGHRLEESLWSYGESWPVAPPPAVAYIHLDLSLPRKPHYPPCILPGSFCWSVNATSSTPRCLWELSPREENIEEERKGRRWCTLSFFLPLLWGESLMLALITICCESNPFSHLKCWSSTWNSSSGRNKQAVDIPKGSPFCWCLMERVLFQQTFTLVLFVERGTPKLSLHPTALSPLC